MNHPQKLFVTLPAKDMLDFYLSECFLSEAAKVTLLPYAGKRLAWDLFITLCVDTVEHELTSAEDIQSLMVMMFTSPVREKLMSEFYRRVKILEHRITFQRQKTD